MNRKLYSRFGAIKERKIDWSKREFVNESKIQSKIKMKSDRTPINLDGSPAGERRPDSHEIIIPVGFSEHWIYLIREFTEGVVFCLHEMQIDELKLLY